MIARLGAATAAALLLVACGGDDGGRWDAEVAATRDALEAGDRDAALASLEEIDADARRAHAEGEVSDEELYELTALVEQARSQLDDELPAATTTTPPTTPPETAPPAGEEGSDDDDKGEKKGKGRGGDDGDDDDDD